MSAAQVQTARVGRPEIEAKLRQIRQEVDRTTQAAKPVGLAVAGVAVVAVVAVAYLAGRRRGRRNRTVVEVRRV